MGVVEGGGGYHFTVQARIIGLPKVYMSKSCRLPSNSQIR